MGYSIVKTFPHSLGLSAVFRQWRAQSHCSYLHGYALEFEVGVTCDTLDENGWVYDYGKFKELKTWLKETFDHKLLIAQDDPKFDALNSLMSDGLAQVMTVERVGTEAFAHLVLRTFQKQLLDDRDAHDRGVRCTYVSCAEHEGNKAIVWEGLS